MVRARPQQGAMLAERRRGARSAEAPTRATRPGAFAWATTGLWPGAVASLLGGCGGGCQEPAARRPEPQTAKATSVRADGPDAQARPSRTPVEVAEQALAVRLPERRKDDLVPALASLPRRHLVAFDARTAFVARLGPAGLQALDQTLADPATASDDAITALLRRAGSDYGVRAGVAANRLVLAVDRGTDRMLTARLRRLAQQAGRWRLVLLTREGDGLVEVWLDPPAPRPTTTGGG